MNLDFDPHNPEDLEALNRLRAAQDDAWEAELRRDREKEYGETEWSFSPSAERFYEGLGR